MCVSVLGNSMEFDSVKVEFENVESRKSIFPNTLVVPFQKNYLVTLRNVIDDIKTDFFWFFASFTDLRWFSHKDYKPIDNHMKVYYTTHPMGGFNMEGNVFLIPTKEFKAQLPNMQKLKDFQNIDYVADPVLYQKPLTKTLFELDNIFGSEERHWTWLINHNLADWELPNFYPSFWEQESVYTWGKTNDIMLICNEVDWTKHINFDLQYPVEKLDIFEIAEKNALTYTLHAAKCKTGYFWAVPPGTKIDELDLGFQPDRTSKPCHYSFGNDIFVLNRQLCIDTKKPGFDKTLVKDVNV